MTRITTAFFSVLLFILAHTDSTGQSKFVTLYTDEFAGGHAELGVGKYDYMTLVRSGVMVVKSIKVPEGLSVKLYDRDGFQGSSIVLTDNANMRHLSSKGFGKLSQNISLEVSLLPDELVKAPVVVIYKDNFSGPSKKLRAGIYDFFELGDVDNDQLSSIKIPNGMKVTVYEHKEMGGRSLALTADASASFLVSKKFNDVASSILVEELPKPVVVVAPVVVVDPVVVPKENPKPAEVKQPEVVETNERAVTVFLNDFSKRFSIGRYDVNILGNGDRTISSIRIQEGLRVILYEQPGFKGKSILVDEDLLPKGYYDAMGFKTVSSLVVELIPTVTIFQGNYSDGSQSFTPGYYNINQIDIGNDELSSVKILPGVWALLFEEDNFKGRSLLLTQDASADFISGRDFDNLTSSLVVGKSEDGLPQATFYQDNFTGPSQKFAPGEYRTLDFNNSISSLEIPRSLTVTLFDEPNFEGKSITLNTRVGVDFLKSSGFNDFASSAIINLLQPRDFTVTIYVDNFSGGSQDLLPGRYRTRDLFIVDNEISSVRVPMGMRATLYEYDNFKGLYQIIDRDTDFTGSRMQDNFYSSLVVESVLSPIIHALPVVATTTEPPKEEKVVPIQEIKIDTVTIYEGPSCEMTEKDYYTALKTIESKPFSGEKMTIARMATKDKCLTNEQIRGIAKLFSFEEQTLEFVKYAYDLGSEKSTYYSLEDVFKFMSSKDSFTKFLSSK